MKRIKVPKYCATLAEYARIERVSRATATRRDQSGQVVWTDDALRRIDIQATRQLVRELATSAGDPEIKAARLQLLQTESRLREMRLRKLEGELIETARVDFVMKDAFLAIRAGFTGFVPWLWSEAAVLVGGGGEQRAGMYALDEKINTVVFNVYVVLCRTLADLANRSGGKAERLAAEAWKTAFPSDWQDEAEKILSTERTAGDAKEKPNTKK